MRLRHTAAQALPRDFSGHAAAQDLIAQCDIGVTPRSRLRAKCLFFGSQRGMRRFWKAMRGENLSPDCLAVVNQLGFERVTFLPGGRERRVWEVDPRYFAIACFSPRALSMEVICHESVHLGCAYTARVAGDFWPGASQHDEERLAYPVGRIAAAINRFAFAKNLYGSS